MTALLPLWALIKRVPVWVWLGLALIIAFYFALDAYGDRRYKAGHDDADAAWQAASDKLIQKAADSSNKADAKQASRDADFAARQADEKEKLDAATANGSSPIDVLFGG